MMRKLLWTVVILLFLWALYAFLHGQASSPAPTVPVAQGPTGDYSITALDQPLSNSVTVASLTLLRPGFVLVHLSQNQAPGTVVGYTNLLQAGSYTNVNVPLTSPVKHGDQLYLMVHTDDDGNGKLDYMQNPKLDAPAVDSRSQVVMTLIVIK